MSLAQFELMAIVAARKAEFYVAARKKLVDSLPESIDRDTASDELRQAVSSLDNRLFIGPREMRTGIVNPLTRVSDLGLDASRIERELLSALARQQRT